MLLIQRQGFEDYAISERSNGTVTFEVIVPLAFGEGVRIGEQVQYKDYRLRVDEIERTRNNYRLVGSLDLQLLKSSIISLNEYQRYTLADLAALIGVTFIGEFNAGETYSRSSLKFNKGTKYDLLKAVFALKHLGAAYRGGLTFYLCDFRQKARKAKHLAHRDLNVINVANRLEGFNQFNTVTVEGKDGITATVTSAAAGEAAVIKYVNDQRFTDPQALRAYAEALLADYSVPYNEYTIKMVETKEQPLQLLDTVKHVGIDGDGEIHRIVELERTNERIEVSLINKRQNLADVFADYQEQQEIKNQEMQLKHDEFVEETKTNFDSVGGKIGALGTKLDKEIADTKHQFSESLIRTKEMFESKYTEIDKRIENVTTTFTSKLTQTAQEIRAAVTRVEQTATAAKTDAAYLSIRADRIESRVTSVEEDVTQAKADISYHWTQISQNSSNIELAASKADSAYDKAVEAKLAVSATNISALVRAEWREVGVIINGYGNVTIKGGLSVYGYSTFSDNVKVYGRVSAARMDINGAELKA